MVMVDPEYFHLFNGLNLAIFNLSVDYIAHPGTSIQVIYAVSAHIVNLVQPDNNVITNALNNPEQFIHGASILLNLLTGSTILLLGVYTYKYTGNIFFAILLQLMPFGNYRLVQIFGRILPETALVAPLLLLTLLVVKFIYDNNKEEKTKKYLLGFAIIGGIGIAGKLSYFPFLIIPLFLFSNTKLRLKYILYTAIAIIIFAFPMFVNIDKSWDWFGNMLLHSGKWGSGEKNFMDISAIPERLTLIYNMDKTLFIVLGLALLQLIVFLVVPVLRKNESLKPFLKTLLAFLLSIAVSVFLVTKHYAGHYFYPNFVFKTFIIFLMAALIIALFRSERIKLVISGLVLLVAIVLLIPQFKHLKPVVQRNQIRAEKFDQRARVLEKYNTIDNPLIITSHYSGSPFIESALVDAFLLSSHLKSTFIEHLTKKYPNTYFYFDWSDQFYFWDQFKDANDFVTTQKPLYVFIGEGREPNLTAILDRLKSDFPDRQPELNLLHHFKAPEEYFYEVQLVEKDQE